MSVEVTTAWVLAWMVKLLPPVLAHGTCEADKSEHRWAESYEVTADAIVSASLAAPLFAGPDGFRRTAAVLLGLAFHESRWDARAIGDGSSALGLYQVHLSTAPKGTTREDLFDPKKASHIALGLLKTSFRICSTFPLLEREGWYAAGGEGCQEAGRKKSRVRMTLAIQITDAKEESP